MPRYNVNGRHLFGPGMAAYSPAVPEDQAKDEIIAELRRRIEELSTCGSSSAASSVGDSSQSGPGGGGSRRSRRRRNKNKVALATTNQQQQQQQQYQQHQHQQSRTAHHATDDVKEVPRSVEKKKVPKLQLGLNLDLELELKARIDGTVTLCLLDD